MEKSNSSWGLPPGSWPGAPPPSGSGCGSWASMARRAAGGRRAGGEGRLGCFLGPRGGWRRRQEAGRRGGWSGGVTALVGTHAGSRDGAPGAAGPGRSCGSLAAAAAARASCSGRHLLQPGEGRGEAGTARPGRRGRGRHPGTRGGRGGREGRSGGRAQEERGRPLALAALPRPHYPGTARSNAPGPPPGALVRPLLLPSPR